ncbi:MAG TPA: folylpolyglutamate synthase/dihydrofolate synthase family protein [Chitinophagaceae bacterium]
MNYKETISYLFSRLPMYSRIGAAAYKPNLDNTIELCASIGNPQTKFKAIHVAGTNGKGSVSHMLAAILQSAGYKTGLYTSPHLKDFRERIKVNGQMIDREFVINFTEGIQPMINKLEPSFFEITVAMAFDFFAHEKVDIAIIETGLGGRLDSTNIITPVLSIITNIGWDHMNILGNSLEKIASEKAGIIKPGIPIVIGEEIPETKPVFVNIASEKKSPITFAGDTRSVVNWNWEDHNLVLEVAEAHHTDHKKYVLDLGGIYQAKNLVTVLSACSVLQSLGWPINDSNIKTGLKQVKKLTGLHGRWEIIHTQPLVVLDVAHNAEGIRQLLQQIEITEHRHLYIILGMVNDKDTSAVLAAMPQQATYYFTKAQIPRALDENELAKRGTDAGLRGTGFADVNTALKSALAKADREDLIVVCGSVFLVGEVEL